MDSTHDPVVAPGRLHDFGSPFLPVDGVLTVQCQVGHGMIHECIARRHRRPRRYSRRQGPRQGEQGGYSWMHLDFTMVVPEACLPAGGHHPRMTARAGAGQQHCRRQLLQ